MSRCNARLVHALQTNAAILGTRARGAARSCTAAVAIAAMQSALADTTGLTAGALLLAAVDRAHWTRVATSVASSCVGGERIPRCATDKEADEEDGRKKLMHVLSLAWARII